ncbi:hypothetical protein GE061_005211 [Apolygus lucorum]|uniref:Single domain-containing protein n=1 Tax=Apolygus lucorum TaxID=248454 RepID=A0A6A4IJE5_APOLU|nr:hypothetical protein GE061_005211 [Apolygus lucorum]
MVPRLCLFVCALVGSVHAILQSDIQYKTNGGCVYHGHHVSLYSEYTPVYQPSDSKGCVRVLCKAYSATHSELAIHSCNPEFVNGEPAELWPGKRYPDCCKKLTY